MKRVDINDFEPVELRRLRAALALLRFVSDPVLGSSTEISGRGSGEWQEPDVARRAYRRALKRMLMRVDRLAKEITKVALGPDQTSSDTQSASPTNSDGA